MFDVVGSDGFSAVRERRGHMGQVISETMGLRSVISVVYAIPEMAELKRRFPGYVDPAYEKIAFTPIRACKKVGSETQEVEFEYFNLLRGMTNKAVLVKMRRSGVRPALPAELLAFVAVQPVEFGESPLVALGAETGSGGGARVACVGGGNGSGLALRLVWIALGGDREWLTAYRFLVVRKS